MHRRPTLDWNGRGEDAEPDSGLDVVAFAATWIVGVLLAASLCGRDVLVHVQHAARRP